MLALENIVDQLTRIIMRGSIPIITTSVMLEQDGKLLLVQEAAAEVYGKWNQPAGHLESGEDIFQCARREAKEESGYAVELTGLQAIYFYSTGQEPTLNFCFRAEPRGEPGSPRPDEVLATRWFTKEELRQFPDDQLRHKLTKRRIQDWLAGRSSSLDVIAFL
ncbi:MAG: NUDIX domain-containing protein [Acidobacteria bacterium]|nr:NUDIX domain-containing protein [Acidobacteriota bacterium]